MHAGRSIPPIAAITGRADFLTDESSPATISLFISSPAAKKNTAIRASLIQCRMDICKDQPPISSPASISHILSNHCVEGTVAISTAKDADTSNNTPPAAG